MFLNLFYYLYFIINYSFYYKKIKHTIPNIKNMFNHVVNKKGNAEEWKESI